VGNHMAPAGVEPPETGRAREFERVAEFVVGYAAVNLAEARPLSFQVPNRVLEQS
jgi:hypothetical protein